MVDGSQGIWSPHPDARAKTVVKHHDGRTTTTAEPQDLSSVVSTGVGAFTDVGFFCRHFPGLETLGESIFHRPQ